MSFRLSLLAGTALIGIAALAPQQASANFTSTPGAPCPTTTADGVNGNGDVASCGAIITLNSNGTASIAFTGSNPYDGVEDTMVGVINNSGGPVGSITLSGSNIFGFDGDGVGTNNVYGDFATQWNGGVSTGPTGYEGPDNSFLIADSNDGTVVFTTALGSGSSTFFSLEENLSTAGFTVTTVTSAPEPASLALLGGGLAALGALRRRKKA